MRLTAATVVLAGIVVAVLCVGGCSGPGVTVQNVRGGTVQTTATDHVTAVLLVKSWFAIIYPKAADGDCGLDWDQEVLPDGSVHVWGTNSDCSPSTSFRRRIVPGVALAPVPMGVSAP